MNTNTSGTKLASPETLSHQRKYPSRFLATLYLLVGMAILIGAGYISAAPVVRYLVGIIAEIALVVIAVIFLKLEKLPLRTTLRLNPVDWHKYLFAVLIVMSGCGGDDDDDSTGVDEPIEQIVENLIKDGGTWTIITTGDGATLESWW